MIDKRGVSYFGKIIVIVFWVFERMDDVGYSLIWD